ncbi:MAG: ribonuclease HII [Candidatus Babeliales bacterium]
MAQSRENLSVETFRPEKDQFEHKAWKNDALVCGIDEAGRGALAGHLVAAAVILPPKTTFPLLKDSKLLTPKQRLEAFTWINRHCFWSIGVATADEIDTINVYKATQKAMLRARGQLLAFYPNLFSHISFFLVDAVPLTSLQPHIPFISYPKGEYWSSSIAAASIVAKVTRDATMYSIDSLMGHYRLGAHKGYGTLEHRKALALHGHSLIHRKSFRINYASSCT